MQPNDAACYDLLCLNVTLLPNDGRIPGGVGCACSDRSGVGCTYSVLRTRYRYRELMASAIIADIWRLAGCVSRADLTKRLRNAIKWLTNGPNSKLQTRNVRNGWNFLSVLECRPVRFYTTKIMFQLSQKMKVAAEHSNGLIAATELRVIQEIITSDLNSSYFEFNGQMTSY